MNGPEAAAAKALIADFTLRVRSSSSSKQNPLFDPKGLNAKERAVLRRLWSQVRSVCGGEMVSNERSLR